MTELGEIPEGWKINSLLECSDGKPMYGIGAPAVDYSDELPTYLRITDIDDMGNFIKSSRVSVDSPESRKYFLNEGDIVFARTGNTVGKNYLYKKVDGELVFAGFLIKFSIDSEKADPRYIKKYCETKKFWDWVKTMSLRSGQPGINAEEYSRLLIPLAPLKEQQKIADILSTVDEHIEETESLIEKTKELKKGLMQRLLTKGIGHTKFKKTEVGEIPVEWEVKRLGELTEIISGGTPDTRKLRYWENGNVYWATPTDITSNGKYINNTEKCITQEGLKNSSAYLLPIGSILMTSRATIGERCINTVPMATNQGFKSFICKGDLYNEYLYYFIDIIKPNFVKLAGGSTFLEISKKEVEAYKIPVPPVEEQRAVATIISGVDNQIVLNQEKLERLRRLKKALMQKLLTGKIRVKI